ncbi:MAG: ribonuclease P protein component [Candidatus Pacebacteria bacterium]|nr:ribonuclease P protein component [Candidatus Paceibacterota bacterium]
MTRSIVASQNNGVKRAARRSKRLRSAQEIGFVKSRGKRSAGRACAVQVVAIPGGQQKTAFVVSRYYSKLAVERNRARRLLREAWRALAADVRKDCWIILRPRRAMKRAKTQDVVSELKGLLRQTGMLVGR